MFKIFNKRNAIKQDIEKLNEVRKVTQQEINELKELEKSIHNQMIELNETIDEAKEYLAMCGITEKDIERIKIKNRLKVIKNGR